MSSESKYLNDQYKGFFEDSLSKTDPELFKAIKTLNYRDCIIMQISLH